MHEPSRVHISHRGVRFRVGHLDSQLFDGLIDGWKLFGLVDVKGSGVGCVQVHQFGALLDKISCSLQETLDVGT
jgi:hypothetical protein